MKQNKAFTILELVVTLAILGTLSGIAIPQVGKWLRNARLHSAAIDLFVDIQHARMVAVKENRNVIVTFDPDGDGALDGTYVVFVDNGHSKSALWTREIDERIVRKGSLPPGVQLLKASFAGGVPKTRFNHMGFPNGLGGHVYMCSKPGAYMGIHVNINGNPRIVKSDNGETGTWN